MIVLPWIVGLAMQPSTLPEVDDPPSEAPSPAPAEPAPSASQTPKDPLALPDKPAGDDPVILTDESQDEREVEPDDVGPVEYRDKFVEGNRPSDQAVARDTTIRRSGKKKWKREGSPQRFGLEVKLGPYLPDVDQNYSGDGIGPYTEIFGKTNDVGEATGDPKNALMVAGAFEWQIVYLAGPLGLGLQLGFMRDKANGLLEDPETDAAGNVTKARSEADTVTFSVLPLALQIVYRLEIFADRWYVPLVPYAKIGPAYAFWWSKDGDRDISQNSAGEKGRGGSWGFQLNAGGMLRLDWIERATSRDLDRVTGINHTYLFGEYQYSLIDNFGRGTGMSLGDSTWFAGLAIEF